MREGVFTGLGVQLRLGGSLDAGSGPYIVGCSSSQEAQFALNQGARFALGEWFEASKRARASKSGRFEEERSTEQGIEGAQVFRWLKILVSCS